MGIKTIKYFGIFLSPLFVGSLSMAANTLNPSLPTNASNRLSCHLILQNGGIDVKNVQVDPYDLKNGEIIHLSEIINFSEVSKSWASDPTTLTALDEAYDSGNLVATVIGKDFESNRIELEIDSLKTGALSTTIKVNLSLSALKNVSKPSLLGKTLSTNDLQNRNANLEPGTLYAFQSKIDGKLTYGVFRSWLDSKRRKLRIISISPRKEDIQVELGSFNQINQVLFIQSQQAAGSSIQITRNGIPFHDLDILKVDEKDQGSGPNLESNFKVDGKVVRIQMTNGSFVPIFGASDVGLQWAIFEMKWLARWQRGGIDSDSEANLLMSHETLLALSRMTNQDLVVKKLRNEFLRINGIQDETALLFPDSLTRIMPRPPIQVELDQNGQLKSIDLRRIDRGIYRLDLVLNKNGGFERSAYYLTVRGP
jgi:hypothetical protein